ncbi:oxidoreductase [Aureococcus anophagefferens]|nr:oxidoreductase [Aureococcus anophagefferens]
MLASTVVRRCDHRCRICTMRAAILAACCATAHALSATQQKTIQRRQLGSSDLVVSDVCLGTMTWGKQNTLEEGVSQLNMAFDDYGINFLDTAEMYPVPTEAETQGATDKTIGEWLRRRGKRDDVVLASKICGASERITWVRDDGRGTRIHWPDRYVPIFGADAYDASNEREYVSFLEQLEAMKDLRDAGKVRHSGVSNETPYGVCQFAAEAAKDGDLPEICSIQNSYSLLVRSDFENGLTEACSMTDAASSHSAAGGILSGKYSGDEPPPGARLNLFPGFMSRYKQSLAKEAVNEYEKVAPPSASRPPACAQVVLHAAPRGVDDHRRDVLAQLRENVDAALRAPMTARPPPFTRRRYRDPSKT